MIQQYLRIDEEIMKIEKEPGPTMKFCLGCLIIVFVTILIQLFTLFFYMHFDLLLSFEYIDKFRMTPMLLLFYRKHLFNLISIGLGTLF